VKILFNLDKRLGVMNWCVDAGRIGGRRIRRRFPTQEQAEMWVKENESIREIESRHPLTSLSANNLVSFWGHFCPKVPTKVPTLLPKITVLLVLIALHRRRVHWSQPLRRHIEMMIADGLLTYGAQLHCPNWTRKLNRIIHSAGIKPLPNGLRYGYAMHRLARGISPWQLACELGTGPSSQFPHADCQRARPVVERDSVGWFSA
jgi:hypothetical protein